MIFALRAVGGDVERNFSGAIVMKRSIFEEQHHVRPDISNEIAGGRS